MPSGAIASDRKRSDHRVNLIANEAEAQVDIEPSTTFPGCLHSEHIVAVRDAPAFDRVPEAGPEGTAEPRRDDPRKHAAEGFGWRVSEDALSTVVPDPNHSSRVRHDDCLCRLRDHRSTTILDSLRGHTCRPRTQPSSRQVDRGQTTEVQPGVATSKGTSQTAHHRSVRSLARGQKDMRVGEGVDHDWLLNGTCRRGTRHETPFIITLVQAAPKRNPLPFICKFFGATLLRRRLAKGIVTKRRNRSECHRVAVRNNGIRFALLINLRWRN